MASLLQRLAGADTPSRLAGRALWHEVAEKIARIGDWEDEDYQEAPGDQ